MKLIAQKQRVALFTIHGLPVLGWFQTEVQSTGPCGIVLVQNREPGAGPGAPEWVVGWYRLGDAGWSSGTYKTSFEEAVEEFAKRANIRREGL